MKKIKKINENEIMVDGCVYQKVEEPKPEFKEGDWVVQMMSGGDVLGRIKIITSDHIEYYDGSGHSSWKGYIRHATVEEIESHLKKICDEKYPRGTKYEDAIFGNRAEVQGILIYFPEGDYMTDGWGGSVYGNGKFAEIIPDKKKLPKTRAEFYKFLGDWANRHTSTTDEFLNDYE